MREYSVRVGRETPPELSFRGRLNFSGGSVTNARDPLSGTTEDIIADLQQYADIGVTLAVVLRCVHRLGVCVLSFGLSAYYIYIINGI